MHVALVVQALLAVYLASTPGPPAPGSVPAALQRAAAAPVSVRLVEAPPPAFIREDASEGDASEEDERDTLGWGYEFALDAFAQVPAGVPPVSPASLPPFLAPGSLFLLCGRLTC